MVSPLNSLNCLDCFGFDHEIGTGINILVYASPADKLSETRFQGSTLTKLPQFARLVQICLVPLPIVWEACCVPLHVVKELDFCHSFHLLDYLLDSLKLDPLNWAY